MEKYFLVFSISSFGGSQYLNQQEVGSLLSISERTVRNWSRKGLLRAYKFGTRVFYKRTEVAQQLVTSKAKKL